MTLPILLFLLFVASTLGITAWAARRTRSADQFLSAGGGISAWQNGFALAGDYLSAGALLGIAGLITRHGFDGLIYSLGWVAGWPILLFLVAEPLRRLGKYSFADVLAARLRSAPVRLATAASSIIVILLYLIAQMVAAGSLVQMLFGIGYRPAVMVVGGVMLVYVLFGGMLATTWVQIIKAALLLGGGVVLALLVLHRFEMNPLALFAAAAHRFGDQVLQPGDKVAGSGWDAMSLSVGLMFGTVGMPHVLMRVFTVRSAAQARNSVLYATCLIGFFHSLVFIIGFGAMVLVGPDAVAASGGGGNMAAPLLARMVGGELFFSFISAVSFATMLAVVAGLTITGAATLSHDCWTAVVRRGRAGEREQLGVARIATVAIAVLATALGVLFQNQNVAFTAGLAFAVAASANFPALLLAILWRRFTTWGAVAGIVAGASSSVVLILLSPTVQIDILGHAAADLAGRWWFVPLRNPALISLPLSLLASVAVSLLTPEPDGQARFASLRRQVLFGASSE